MYILFDGQVRKRSEVNGRRALAEYPDVARVESQAVCRCTVCPQHFLQTSFKFADLVPHSLLRLKIVAQQSVYESREVKSDENAIQGQAIHYPVSGAREGSVLHCFLKALR